MESLYLDTSVPSAYYDKRAYERMLETRRFWKNKVPGFHINISEITLDELRETKDINLRNKLLKIIKDFNMLKINNEIKEHAGNYIKQGIFPEKYFNDSLHVSIATFFRIDFIVSWNFEHLVKVKTRKLVNTVNLSKGYGEIQIISPLEL